MNPHIPFLTNPALFKTAAYINGTWQTASDQRTFPVSNPANDHIIAYVANLGPLEAEQAIHAAEMAWSKWRKKTGKERAAILRKWFELIMANSEDLAQIMTAEQGKPLAEARGEVAYGASFIEWFAEEAKRVCGDIPASPWSTHRIMVLKQPIGVCASITPWNFPIAMITRKVAPALAAGCPIIVKPAEQTPLSALALAVLAEEAGIPPGVLNVLTADSSQSVEIGKILCSSSTVRHLSFTGSTPVGKILMAQSAQTVKKMSLELGGLAPFIVFDDADLEAAIQGALISKYRNAGQTCVCANRFYVQAGIYEAFVDRLARASSSMKVGVGTENGVLIGPLIDADAVHKAEMHVHDALEKGARLLTGGKRLDMGHYFFAPTVLADVTPNMLIMQEETFGPVAAIQRFETETEVINAANHTDFGLASYLFSRDIGRIFRVAEALEYGMVGINTGMISNEVGPFGGVKQSGLGREGSQYGIDEYLEMKYMCLGNG